MLEFVKAFRLAICSSLLLFAAPPGAKLWRFDRLDKIDGHKVTVLGHPRVIRTPWGKALEFNGVDDAIFVDAHPLAGVEQFAWEAIFRPDPGGNRAQRFFHLQEEGTDNRMLFEIRVVGNQWCLDSFAKSGEESRALMDPKKLHPLGTWHHVAAVYDGREFRNYVNGVLEGSGPLHLAPHGPGGSSIAVRFNRVDYFKGAILLGRMTPRALTPSEFLKTLR
jgi:hypothetical protein